MKQIYVIDFTGASYDYMNIAEKLKSKAGGSLDRTYYITDNSVWDENAIYEYVEGIFKGFTDAVIPQSPELAEEYGNIQYYGALDLFTYEYLIMELESLSIPMALPVAIVLEAAAEQFLYKNGDKPEDLDISDGSLFFSLSPSRRLQAVNLLIQPGGLQYFPVLPQLRQEDVFPVIMSLNRLTLMGYYSEWSGYGSTRLNPPGQRTLENFPVSWEQIGYPGPSKGYRDARSYSYT